MKVYVWWNAQGSGWMGVCSTLDGAKARLMASIATHGRDDGTGKWDGWKWWQRGGVWMFGCDPEERVAEGSVEEMLLDGPA